MPSTHRFIKLGRIIKVTWFIPLERTKAMYKIPRKVTSGFNFFSVIVGFV